MRVISLLRGAMALLAVVFIFCGCRGESRQDRQRAEAEELGVSLDRYKELVASYQKQGFGDEQACAREVAAHLRGFTSAAESASARSSGFDNASQWYEAKQNEFANRDDYEAARNRMKEVGYTDLKAFLSDESAARKFGMSVGDYRAERLKQDEALRKQTDAEREGLLTIPIGNAITTRDTPLFSSVSAAQSCLSDPESAHDGSPACTDATIEILKAGQQLSLPTGGVASENADFLAVRVENGTSHGRTGVVAIGALAVRTREGSLRGSDLQRLLRAPWMQPYIEANRLK